jgi:hypothetical protein
VKMPLRGAAWGRAPKAAPRLRPDPEEEIVGTVREVAPVVDSR